MVKLEAPMKDVFSIAIRDRAFAHCLFSNNPTIPVSFSKYMRWDWADTSRPAVYTDGCIDVAPDGATVWLIEPRTRNEERYESVENSGRFSAIWTHDRRLIVKNQRATFVPVGGCWIAVDDRKIWAKSRMVSIVASPKTGPGYDLRHDAIRKFRPLLDAYGNTYGGYVPKLAALRDYHYSLAFENCRHDSFFTEKLIDCFSTGTVPIYWGCPGIGDFFNKDGIIIVDNLDDLQRELPQCTKERYVVMADAIADNFERAKKYHLTEDWIVENKPELFDSLR